MFDIQKSKLLAIKWLKIGWGEVSALGALLLTVDRFQWVWRRVSDLFTAKDVWKFFGGDMIMFISIVSHPFFGLGLILTGLIGIPLAIKSDDNQKVEKFALIIGWLLFGMASAFIIAALLGDRLSNSDLITKAGRFYIEKHTIRSLSDDDKKLIHSKICPHKDDIKDITVYAIDDSEAYQYAEQLFVTLGYRLKPFNPFHAIKPTTPNLVHGMPVSNRGISVVVKDKDHPDIRSSVLFDALQDAGIIIEYTME
ncbi:hypothetical protein [Methylocystis sp.]|uniref:hypothetical protein n=1 Tax=Methylocystis sp. TaxID=1911079 RepID=UPI003D0B2340